MSGRKPNALALSKKNLYDTYLRYTPFQLQNAFRISLTRQKVIAEEIDQSSCDGIIVDGVPPHIKYTHVDPRSLVSHSSTKLDLATEQYVRCKMLGVKSFTKTNKSDKIDSWNSIFLKMIGLNPRVVSSGVYGIVTRGKTDGVPVVIKTGMKVMRRKELLHEYVVGIYLNQITTIAQHFPSMYGILEGCSIPYVLNINGEKVITNSCNSPGWFQSKDRIKPENFGSSHLLMEDVGVSQTLNDLVDDWMSKLESSGTADGVNSRTHIDLSREITRSFYLIILQLYCVLATAYKHIGFIHGDLHSKNVLIVTTPKEIDYEYQLSKSLITIRTKYKVIIIDYGFSSIKVNCNRMTDATSFSGTGLESTTADHLSSVEVPWFDVVRLIGTMALNMKGMMMDPNLNWDKWKAARKAANRVFYAEELVKGILYLLGSIMEYPKDVVSRENARGEDHVERMEKVGADTVEYARRDNAYFLSNLSSPNIPSSECLVFLMIHDPLISETTRGFVGLDTAKSFFNQVKVNTRTIGKFVKREGLSMDEFDTTMLIANGVKSFTAVVSVDERIDELLRFAESRKIDVQPKSGIMSIIIGGNHMTAFKLTPILKYVDAVMLTLDTALVLKSAVEMILANLEIDSIDRSSGRFRNITKLVDMTNSFIVHANTFMSSMTMELFYSLRKYGMDKFERRLRVFYVINDSYPVEFIRQLSRTAKKVFDYADKRPKDVIVKNTDGFKMHNYIDVLSTLDDSEKTNMLMIMPNIFSQGIIVGKIRGSNAQSFIMKVLTFIPIKIVDL